MAKILRRDVQSFTIGIGPSLIDKNIGGVRFRVDAIPFSGYVELDPFEEPKTLKILLSNLLMFFSGVIAILIFGTILSGYLLDVREGTFIINSFVNDIKNILISIYQIIFKGYRLKDYFNYVYNDCLDKSFFVTIIGDAEYISALNIIINMLPLPSLTCGRFIKEIIKYMKLKRNNI